MVLQQYSVKVIKIPQAASFGGLVNRLIAICASTGKEFRVLPALHRNNKERPFD
jgi:hypothetical protein